MQSMENDKTVFHPSHSRLEDADEARVSHIPTTTTTGLGKEDKQQILLHLNRGVSNPLQVLDLAKEKTILLIRRSERVCSETATFWVETSQKAANCPKVSRPSEGETERRCLLLLAMLGFCHGSLGHRAIF